MTTTLRSQVGSALLMLLFLIVGIGTTLLLSSLSPGQQQREQNSRTQAALRQAKEALIAWSVTHKSIPGRLPCPEDITTIGTPTEGKALSNCTSPSILIGRIAWRDLGLSEPRDGTGEQLWYVLSPGFRSTPPVGSAGVANGQLQLDGTYNGIAALIIAPGTPLPGQTRTPPSIASPPASVNYLDLGNATGPAFVNNGPAATFNDQVITITTQELLQALSSRVLAEIRGAFDVQNGLRRYYNDNGSFPPAGTPLDNLNFDNTTRSWLAPTANPGLWFSLVGYTTPSPTTAQLTLGTLTLKVIPCTAAPCP
ncbi:hypothetical protein LZ012_06240 [Dechloromonas sp. XY25]|uniref:Type II secretion system protein n=1 Tax=Dechloromonas hankyongensis TaxID=2908002 RepID=A0ABS9K0H6_9RHOO|nr:hypothetical protein [Dechloromonas hankyongensis]MCG2576594.1 hypothetical protein [Dechloromonas hankyongensis]